MKYLKRLGFATITALSLMAAVGAGAASAGTAATICSDSGTGDFCGGSHGKHYNGVFHTHTGVANFTWKSSFFTIHCDSTASGTVNTDASGTVTALMLHNCTSSQATNCSASMTASGAFPWALSVVKDTTGTPTGTDGKVRIKQPTGSTTCTVLGIKTTCIYSAGEVGQNGEITVTGGTTATVKGNSIKVNREAGSGFGCTEITDWSFIYQVATPHTLYLT